MNQKDISLELYKVFYYVAKQLSFSKAAKALYISQSAISQSISSLESKLDTKLFVRSTKKVTLTREGQDMLKYIEPAMHLIENGENLLLKGQTLDSGKLHIGASDTICRYYLLEHLEKFHQIYPNVTIQITNRTSIDCVSLLNQGDVDFIITNLPNDYITTEMDVTPVMAFTDVFITSESFPDLLNRQVDMADLLNYPILMLEPNTTTFEYISKKFSQLGHHLQADVALGSIDLLIDMAKIGIGISYVPDYCIKADPKIHPIHLIESLPKRHLGIVTKKGHPLSKGSQTFMEMLI